MELHITAIASHRTAMHLYGNYIHLNWEAIEKLQNGETSSADVKHIMYSTDAATIWKYVLTERGGRGGAFGICFLDCLLSSPLCITL